jgi:hypothetical protein
LHPGKVARKEKVMFFVLLLVLLPIVLAILANLWGYDSRDGLNSVEWERRDPFCCTD